MIPSARDPIECAVEAILGSLGEDPARVGLKKTPHRVAEALRFLTSGYEKTLDEVINGAVYPTSSKGVVLLRDISLQSMCEHHLLPMYGNAHIAYIPDKHVIGLSKVPRVIDMFARRLQLQEKLTTQVADALYDVLRPKALSVVVDLSHMCVSMRGSCRVSASTVTWETRGEEASILRLNADLPLFDLLTEGRE